MRFIPFLCVIAICLGACTGAWEHYPASQTELKAENPLLQAGDIVTVDIYGENDLSGDYMVTNRGDIAMPLAGNVAVQGLNSIQATQKVRDAMVDGGYLVNPKITIGVTKARQFAILGEVLNGGEYAYKDGMTVLEAVAKGGGFSYRANQNTFDIVRKTPDGGEELVPANLSTRIAPGDVIRVRERFF